MVSPNERMSVRESTHKKGTMVTALELMEH